MRIVSIIEIRDGKVNDIQSFGIFDEQHSGEIVHQVETIFGEMAKDNFPEISSDELEACIEDGHFEMEDGYVLEIVWSEI